MFSADQGVDISEISKIGVSKILPSVFLPSSQHDPLEDDNIGVKVERSDGDSIHTPLEKRNFDSARQQKSSKNVLSSCGMLFALYKHPCNS